MTRAETLDGLKGKRFPVLDHGSLTLVDVMGDDKAIADAARTSYGKGTRKVSEDRDLIRYLYRKNHSSPFEMCSVKFHVRAPIFVVRQMERHRAGRMCEEQSCWDDPSANEYSARFSEAITDMAATPPDGWRGQSAANKQGSAGAVTGWPEDYINSPMMNGWLDPGPYLTDRERELHGDARRVYEERLAFGVAREQARKDLPQSCYSEAVICFDLRNLLHAIGLRTKPDVQPETRAYFETLGREIVTPLFPIAWEAFEAYTLSALTLSRLDIEVIGHVRAGCDPEKALAGVFANARERAECRDKLARLGILPIA